MRVDGSILLMRPGVSFFVCAMLIFCIVLTGGVCCSEASSLLLHSLRHGVVGSILVDMVMKRHSG